MSWEAIGAIGEVIGALAVVVTLAYLASQVRYAKIAASDSNRLVRASGVREMYLSMTQDPALTLEVAAADPVNLAHYEAFAANFGITLEQAARIDSQNQYYFWLHWGQFASSQAATDREELRNLVQGFYRVPHVKYSWEHGPYAKLLLEPRFVKFIDETLAET